MRRYYTSRVARTFSRERMKSVRPSGTEHAFVRDLLPHRGGSILAYAKLAHILEFWHGVLIDIRKLVHRPAKRDCKKARAGRVLVLRVFDVLELEPEGPGRTQRISWRLGISARNVRLALSELRASGWQVPFAPSGRRLREDYEESRRGERRARFPEYSSAAETRIVAIRVLKNPDRGDPSFPPTHLTPPNSSMTLTLPPSGGVQGGPRPRDALHADELACARSFGEGGREAFKIMGQIRRAWPQASPAEAANAIQKFLDFPGATLALARAWFEIAPREPGIELARVPWRAAVTQHRAGAWLAARLAADERTRNDEHEVRKISMHSDRVSEMPKNVRARLEELGFLRRVK